MNADEIKINSSDLKNFQNAAIIAAEIAILKAEIESYTKDALKAIKKTDLKGYQKIREKLAATYSEIYVLQDKLRDEIEKIKKEKEEK